MAVAEYFTGAPESGQIKSDSGRPFRSHASSKRKNERNASESSGARTFSPVVSWMSWRSDKSVPSAVERMALWNSEEDWGDDLAECPSIYTNGQEVGKTCQRKNTRPISEIFLVSFSFFRPRTKRLAHARKDLGGSDPVSTFGRQNRTNTGVAPAQIEVFACGLFAAPF
jgi:hypothetical protein